MLKFQILCLCLAFLTAGAKGSLIEAKLCGGVTDAVETNFLSTGSILSDKCTLELVVNPDTCAIRLDFLDFAFSQPTKKNDSSAYVCALDQNLLELKGLGLPPIELSVLCGVLSGQHIVLPTKDLDLDLPVLTTLTQKKLVLSVLLGVALPGVPTPSWNIKLTQLLCPGAENNDSKSNRSLLAPIGCLQYHVEKTGIIESLNYNDGNGHYLGDLNYAICFKRNVDTCGIRLTAIDFALASNDNSSCSTDRDCDSLIGLDVLANTGDVLPNKDYIIVPGGIGLGLDVGVKVLASKYCGNSLKLLDVTVKTAGPLFVGVVTDGLSDLLHLELGFKIKYELLTNCIDLPV